MLYTLTCINVLYLLYTLERQLHFIVTLIFTATGQLNTIERTRRHLVVFPHFRLWLSPPMCLLASSEIVHGQYNGNLSWQME